jgi:hypothetical protein
MFGFVKPNQKVTQKLSKTKVFTKNEKLHNIVLNFKHFKTLLIVFCSLRAFYL